MTRVMDLETRKKEALERAANKEKEAEDKLLRRLLQKEERERRKVGVLATPFRFLFLAILNVRPGSSAGATFRGHRSQHGWRKRRSASGARRAA
jgi:hypothetical protein